MWILLVFSFPCTTGISFLFILLGGLAALYPGRDGVGISFGLLVACIICTDGDMHHSKGVFNSVLLLDISSLGFGFRVFGTTHLAGLRFCCLTYHCPFAIGGSCHSFVEFPCVETRVLGLECSRLLTSPIQVFISFFLSVIINQASFNKTFSYLIFHQCFVGIGLLACAKNSFTLREHGKSEYVSLNVCHF